MLKYRNKNFLKKLPRNQAYIPVLKYNVNMNSDNNIDYIIERGGVLPDFSDANKSFGDLSDGEKKYKYLVDVVKPIELTDSKYRMSHFYSGSVYRTMTEIPNRDDKIWDTSELTTMESMFFRCNKLMEIDLSGFDTSHVTDMVWMFIGCNSIKNLDLSSFDTSNVTEMSTMFGDCISLVHLDISNFDTSKVNDMEKMFMNCRELTTINGVIDMKSCTKYSMMFYDCNKITGVKIKNPPKDFEAKISLTSSQYTVIQ